MMKRILLLQKVTAETGSEIEVRIRFIKTFLPYFFLTLALLALHWGMSLDLSDDGIFKDALDEMSVLEHAVYLYLYVNGKVFPDSMAAIFTRLNPWVWKSIDILMYLTIAACINRFFAPACGTSLPGCLAVLLVPFSILNSAGWVATSTNYIWTTAALLVALLPVKCARTLRERKWLCLFCILGCVYASGQEQSGAILATVYLIYISACKCRRIPVGKTVWICFLAALAGMLFMFAAPGHRIRAAAVYSIFSIPEYLHMDLFEKLLRGFTSTAAYLFSGNTAVWLVFCLLLVLAVFAYCRDPFRGLVSAFPLLYNLVFGVYKNRFLPQRLLALYCFYPREGFVTPEYPYLDAQTYPEWIYYVPLFLSILVVGVILLSLLWLAEAGFPVLELFLAFSAGLCSRLVMGLSPSLYGSGLRTFLFFYFALGICIVILLGRTAERSKLCAAAGSAALVLGVIYTFPVSFYSIH